MRDHPAHAIAFGSFQKGILGGMWGSKRGNFTIENRVKRYTWKNSKYGSDQQFLFGLYQAFEDDMIQHDELGGHNKFPMSRENYHFIGERIDENDKRVGNDYKILMK